jgi:hypothetical protein
MLVSRTRLLSALAVLAVPAALLALPVAGRASDIDKSLVAGEYPGLWHGSNVKFIFEKVRPDGTFTGVMRFGKDTPWPDYTTAFGGRIERDGSITVNRDKKTDKQTSKAGPPKREKGNLIWEGRTTGDDLDANTVFPFQLRVPMK